MTPIVHTLAWRPFIDPVTVHEHWYLLIFPLALGIAMAYKAVRVADMRTYRREVLVMTVMIVGGMFLLGLASYLFVEVYLRMFWG